jgi:formylglycine-generating enzyme required for sulfatase activity
VTVSLDLICNRSDDSVQIMCPIQSNVIAGSERSFWFAFGSVRSATGEGWEPASAIGRVGDGLFDSLGDEVKRVVGNPYIVLDVKALPQVDSNGKLDVRVAITVRKLPVWHHGKGITPVNVIQKREISVTGNQETIIPVLVADPREQTSFAVRELMLRIRGHVWGQIHQQYGAIAVLADMPGADIFLDDGLVGNTVEGKAADLANITVGKHVIRVVDASGRSANREVHVSHGQTITVEVALMKEDGSPGPLMAIGKNPQGYEEFWRKKDGAVTVSIPAGEFIMGSADKEGEPTERPQRRVFVSEFLIDKTEVTWRQFKKFAQATGKQLPPAPLWGMDDNYPVCGVLHAEAQAYCEWVGGRLPTEAEWEKAARGTNGWKYPWGDAWDPYKCNAIDGGPHRPLAVGRFPQGISPFGLLDMLGNVWEWCADWYHEGYDIKSVRDPTGATNGEGRVLRGGYWLSHEFSMRAACRYKNDPTWRNSVNGFRCVQSTLLGQPADHHD